MLYRHIGDPSDKRLHDYADYALNHQCVMAKLTISMAIFNSKLLAYRTVPVWMVPSNAISIGTIPIGTIMNLSPNRENSPNSVDM